MLSDEEDTYEEVLAAFEKRSYAGNMGVRLSRQDEVCPVLQIDWQQLAYLVFDGHKLVAAFAMRDDAELWIEECGNHAMKLRRASRSFPPSRPRRQGAGRSGDQGRGLGSGKR
jgi:hypothetical protein